MDVFIRAMKAMADPNRDKIVKMLQHKMLCVCELQSALGISQPNVSKHLKILEDAGFVVSMKEGLWVNYTLTDGGKSPYAASLLGNLRHWLNDDPDVVKLVQKVPSLDRNRLCKG